MMDLEETLDLDLGMIKNYIDVDLLPAETTTTHIYETQVPVDVKRYISNVKNSVNINLPVF